MSQLDQYQAVQSFLLDNLEIFRDWHQRVAKRMLTYMNIKDFDAEDYSKGSINAMFDQFEDDKIYEFFRQINLLTYNSRGKLKFSYLEELLSSKFQLSIVSLMTKFPIENLDNIFKIQALEKLISNEIYNWMISEESCPSESLKIKEKIMDFVTYFYFVKKFPPSGFDGIKSISKSNLEKTAKMLMEYALENYVCIDEFFLFSRKILKLEPVDFPFLISYKLNELIDRVNSWYTFSKILKSTVRFKFDKRTIEIIWKKINDYFDWDWDRILDFFTSSSEILKLSFEHFTCNYKKLKDERSIEMMKIVLESVKIYANQYRNSANELFKNLHLDSFIKKKRIFKVFIVQIKNIINSHPYFLGR